MSRAHHPTIRIALLLGLTWLAAGCAAGSAWGMVLASLLSLAAIGFAGCGESHSATDASTVEPRPGDGGVDAGPDAGPDDGMWEPCCVEGTVDTCYCPPDTICNYGAFVDCGGGTCGLGGECPDAGSPDAGSPDAGPPDAGPPDAGPPDAGVDAGPEDGGTWDVCCVEGMVDTCYCPPGVACNYGWFEACGEGLCVPPGETCPESP